MVFDLGIRKELDVRLLDCVCVGVFRDFGSELRGAGRVFMGLRLFRFFYAVLGLVF